MQLKFDSIDSEARTVSLIFSSSRLLSAALSAFREGRATVLVASDAMTRGMDVDDVAAVVSYDAPVYAKTYVHRVGRTARAGKEGAAYTILRKAEVGLGDGMGWVHGIMWAGIVQIIT